MITAKAGETVYRLFDTAGAAAYYYEAVGEADYKVTGRTLVIRIPCAMLGLSDTEEGLCFKWSDNVEDGDILNFYTQGDTAPTGRFVYVYLVG